VDGINVKDYPKNGLTDRIAMVPQKAVLFEGSIRDNLTMGLTGVSDEDLWKALETAQAKEVVEGKDGKLDAGVEQNGRNFSGGQKQRLTIARALARKPEILVLDDSSSALDFATDAALRKAINNLEGDLTVFIVSQRTSSIRNADQILVLDDGKLVGKGSHDELLKTCEVYQEIHASQFPGEEVQA
jgi:ABC-type multidrug transport system fused ATPase/permease subunit